MRTMGGRGEGLRVRVEEQEQDEGEKAYLHFRGTTHPVYAVRCWASPRSHGTICGWLVDGVWMIVWIVENGHWMVIWRGQDGYWIVFRWLWMVIGWFVG